MRLQNTAVSIKDVCRLWTHPVVIGSGQRLVRAGNDSSTAQRQEYQTALLLDGWQPTESQSINALALAMLGVDTAHHCFESDRA